MGEAASCSRCMETPPHPNDALVDGVNRTHPLEPSPPLLFQKGRRPEPQEDVRSPRKTSEALSSCEVPG